MSVQSQHDAQKQREWTKRLTDIVGLKLVADYQSTLQVQIWPGSQTLTGSTHVHTLVRA